MPTSSPGSTPGIDAAALPRAAAPARRRLEAVVGIGTVVLSAAACLAGRGALAQAPWHFAVSGDSRNCGDVVMPSIAAGARGDHAVFYWHLGDLRAIYDFDEDYKVLHPQAPIIDYLNTAWLDFQRNQIEAFGDTPFFVGIGNHETIAPKTRDEFVVTFADWLNAPAIREQRLRDDPRDHRIRPYYHWIRDGIDFINLDNATPEQFDAGQLKWLFTRLSNAAHDTGIRAVVVGMHEALPESRARGHSMSDSPAAQASGLQVYEQLLETRKTKPVYVLASHSHFVMEDVFQTPYWRAHGGVLPGWIIGTAGAVRYALPPDRAPGKLARTHVYGYLLATVDAPGGTPGDPLHFEFHEVTEAAVPADVVRRFGTEFVHRCYEENAQN